MNIQLILNVIRVNFNSTLSKLQTNFELTLNELIVTLGKLHNQSTNLEMET